VPETIVYVDECGLDESICREYARAPRGQKIITDISGNRSQRTSIIAGYNQKTSMAPMVFQGYCNTLVVKSWLKEVLIPELTAGQVVIWDNARFHKASEFEELIEEAGCRLIFLPAYSPDLNPIEQWWAVLKAKIRRLRRWADLTIEEALERIFKKTD
jgi:transposase